MRKIAPVGLVAFALLVAAPSISAAGQPGRPVRVRGGIVVRLPGGWHVLRQRFTDVVIPIPRLAVASFQVRLRVHACACGLPNIRNLPRAGAFLLIWEWPLASPRQLNRYPARPARFSVRQGNPHWFECAGPSWTTDFRTSGRVFQVEVYLGPAAGSATRSRVDGILESLQATR